MLRSSVVSWKYLWFVTGFVFFFINPCSNLCFAQPLERVEIPSSMNPVGSGARALGMGGAFIAVADDATAASWNPGGLVQLERPEVSVVGAYFFRAEDIGFGTNPEASGGEDVSAGRINYLSASYPFTVFNRNMVVSANYQNLYDFTRDWRFPLRQSVDNLSVDQTVDYDQNGSLSAIGMAYAVQISPRFSFGLTLNFWEDGIYQNEWKQTTRQQGSGTYVGFPFTFEAKSRDKYNFSGFNVNLGMLWQVTGKLTLGAVFKSPFTASLKHTSSFESSIVFPDFPTAGSTSEESSEEHEDLDMPMSCGLGVAYRFSDKLTVSADIYRTEWQDFVLEDSDGNDISPISGLPEDESDIDPTHQVRTGAEYLFIRENYVIPIRGGVFYDPAPAEGSPDNYFGFSLGSGVAYKRFVFDIAYQYRFGNDVGESIMQSMEFSEDVKEHTLYASLIVHF
jgi:long-chain fatty acid transport protein